jgi:hypothetical protein
MRLKSRITGFGKIRNDRGFTLIEAMVASVAMILALGALMMIFHRDEAAREISNRVIESRQNARSAMDFMVSEIRMAGSGISGAVVTSNEFGDSVIVYPVTPDSINGRREVITLLGKSGDVETTLGSTMLLASSTIAVVDTTGFLPNDLIVVTNGSFSHLFEVTAVQGGGGILEHDASSSYNRAAGHVPWPAAGFATGSRVVKVNLITYYLDRSDSTCPTIMRRVGLGEARPISEYVNSMDLLYELQDQTQVAAPADPLLVRKVIVTIEAASAESDREHVTRLVSSAKPRCM